MKVKLMIFLLLSSLVPVCLAETYCYGRAGLIKKDTNKDHLSIFLNVDDSSGGGSFWITMDSKSSESIALLAFASKKKLLIYWSSPNITSCSGTGGPSGEQVLDGWMSLQDR